MKWWRHLRTFVRTMKVRVKKKAKNIRSFSLILQGWYFWTKKNRQILTKKVTLNPNFFNPKFFRTFLYLIFLNKQNFPIEILRGDGLEAARMVGQMCIFSKELKTISAKQSFWVKSIWWVCLCKVLNKITDICIIKITKCQCFKL